MKSAPTNALPNHKQKAQSTAESAHGNVDKVVQEYMDNLLGDLFPELDEKAEQQAESKVVTLTSVSEPPLPVSVESIEPRTGPDSIRTEGMTQTKMPTEAPEQSRPLSSINTDKLDALPLVTPEVVDKALKASGVNKTETYETTLKVDQRLDIRETIKASEVITQSATEPKQAEVSIAPPVVTSNDPILNKTSEKTSDAPNSESLVQPQVVALTEQELQPEIEKRYPNAPSWAQEAFDVLLFDVCGLKLAVPMESLGRIIKVEHETNQLIGRPDWFIGAYNEADEHLYAVDTAKYIMPEKGFDLERDGFAYLIQLQKSKWTLACQNVRTTVRLEPDQVKWRSSQGKRNWLSGTVIEHMCALIHVDNLVAILESDS